MNAFTLLPVAVPLMALGIYAALRFARWLDRPTLLRQAIIWHNAVVDHERTQGRYIYDGSITDIRVDHGYVT
jgi:hypothetical protein